MPVTVKEMQINTTVSGDASTSGKDSKAASGGGGGKGLSKLDKEIIIKEAVKRALEEMEYRMGR